MGNNISDCTQVNSTTNHTKADFFPFHLHNTTLLSVLSELQITVSTESCGPVPSTDYNIVLPGSVVGPEVTCSLTLWRALPQSFEILTR